MKAIPKGELRPKAFVAEVINELENLCKLALLEQTGSTLQRGVFDEMDDCVHLLLNPDKLSDIKYTTTNDFIYRQLKFINWDALENSEE